MQWGRRYVREDRREYQRLPARIPVTFIWGGREAAGVVTDLSMGGAAIESDAGVPAGQAVRLRFAARGAESDLLVDVVFVRSARVGRVGVEFGDQPDQQSERLARLLMQLVQEMRRS
jgi:hypothetical protein